MQQSFLITSKNKTIKLPFQFKHWNSLPDKITILFINNKNRQYCIQSDVSDEVFESFVNYLITDTLPKINIQNIQEYMQLSQEFNLLGDFIEKKKKDFGKSYEGMLFLLNKKNPKDVSHIEKDIAMKLDYYLEKYGEKLMNSPIQSLINIFNHRERKLTNHNLAYNLIKEQVKRTNDPSYNVLITTLDCSHLNHTNIEESFLLKKERFDLMPDYDKSFVSSFHERELKFEKRISKLETGLKALLSKFDEMQNSIGKIGNNQNLKEKIESISKIQTQSIQRINQIENFIKTKEDRDSRRITTTLGEQTKKISILEKKQHDDQKEFKSLYEDIAFLKERTKNIFSLHAGKHNPGILHQLKSNEKSPFDPLFIASQSSNDIYNIIDPHSKDNFITGIDGDFYIEFELKENIQINGIQIFTSNQCFPKSFDIEIDGVKTASIKSAQELNGAFKSMIVKFDSISCQKVKLIQTESNWDIGNNCLNIQRIELLSPEEKYKKGVFSKLVSMSPSKDPHKCPVIISSSCFDFNTFHLLGSSKNICLYGRQNAWFQIELTGGFAIIHGFRILRFKGIKLKSYKIICTNDVSLPTNEWETLMEVGQNDADEPEIFQFEKPSPPVRFVRIIQAKEDWFDDLFLAFYHFDIFGVYI